MENKRKKRPVTLPCRGGEIFQDDWVKALILDEDGTLVDSYDSVNQGVQEARDLGIHELEQNDLEKEFQFGIYKLVKVVSVKRAAMQVKVWTA